MRASHNRARIAERIQAARRTPGTIGTDLALRHQTVAPLRTEGFRGHKRRKGRGPGSTQRDTNGQRSAWTASPYFYADSAWSRTVSDPRP